MKVEDINFLVGILIDCLVKCHCCKDCERLGELILHFITELNSAYTKGDKNV